MVNHKEDLLEIFGKDIMDKINYERAAQKKLMTSSIIPSMETSHFICHPNKLIGFFVRLAMFADNLLVILWKVLYTELTSLCDIYGTSIFTFFCETNSH